MFKPDPIGGGFLPYTRRPRGKHNSGLFVEGGSGVKISRSASRIGSQARVSLASCNNKFDCWPGYECVHGECVGVGPRYY